jgi:hypothetical protein
LLRESITVSGWAESQRTGQQRLRHGTNPLARALGHHSPGGLESRIFGAFF